MKSQPLLLLTLVTTVSAAFAQVQPATFSQKPVKRPLPQQQASTFLRAQQCGPDTVYYAYDKATSLQGLNINTATSADKAAQWFDAPQQLLLHGFTFFAWQSGQTADSVTLTCRVVLAGSDSLPTGPVVASTTVVVDSTFGNGSLNVLQKTALFSSPVLLDFPYALVVETASPLNVALVTNDWDSADGGSEWLGMASIPGSGWLHGYNVNVGAVSFNADFIFNPIVTYEIDAQFTADTTCVANGGVVDFTNTTNSPVLHSRFYNQYVVNGTEQLIYTWDYDDGSPLDLLTDTSHAFAPGFDYNVTLRSNLVGWSSVCQESAMVVINPSVTSNFTFVQNGLTVQFTNTSSGTVDCYWNFGDGTTSADVNPIHTYAAENNYNVTLITIGQCAGDTAKTTLSLCSPLSSNFTFDATGLSVDFVVTAISGSTSFNWTFGDGASGSGIAPTHIYPEAGAYPACLIATNSCTSDTTCQQVNVVSTIIPKANAKPSVQVYPNPADDGITVEFSNPEAASEILLTDEKGAAVKKWIPEKAERIHVLNMSEIAPGAYFLTAKLSAGGMVTQSVIIR